MITITPIVIADAKHRRRDGTFLVYIRVYFSGKSRRIPTGIVCTQADITRSGRIKSQSVMEAANAVARKMRSSVEKLTDAELEGKDVGWVVDRMRFADLAHSFRLDFFQFADGVVATKSRSGQCQYITALNTFAEFLGKREIDINDITKPLLGEFLSWMSANRVHFDSNGLSPRGRTRIPNGAESRAMAKLSHIFEKAKAQYNDEDEDAILIPRSPFSALKIKHPPSKGQNSLGVEMMQRVIDARHPLETVQTALDVFVLSFALMGVNLADLYEAKRVGLVWRYNRKKTRTRRADGAEMRVTIPKEVRPIVAGLQSGPDGWWLPALHRMAGKEQYVTAKVNKGLARWCEDEGVPVFTFYAARHTWATLARSKAGVDKATVDECLCHIGDYKLTDIYLERDWDLMDAANRRVLDLFRW